MKIIISKKFDSDFLAIVREMNEKKLETLTREGITLSRSGNERKKVTKVTVEGKTFYVTIDILGGKSNIANKAMLLPY